MPEFHSLVQLYNNLYIDTDNLVFKHVGEILW